MTPWTRRLGPLLIIGALHAALLWWLASELTRRPKPLVPPTMMTLLMPPSPSITEPVPLPVQAMPLPLQAMPIPPTLQAVPKPLALPKPVKPPPIITPPRSTPSDTAVSAPPPEPPAPRPTEPLARVVEQPAAAAATPTAATAATATSAAVSPVPPAAKEATPLPLIPPRSDAAHLNNPAPNYPPVSRKTGEQGRVLIDVYILADGSVGQIKLKKSSGYPRLDDAAIDAVRRWRYQPARRGDEAINFWYVQPLNFSLES
jgi:periplasmic protein TonB